MSNQTISPVEQELNAIRIELYEETKDMTTSERVSYLNQLAEDTVLKHGYKFVPVGDKGARRLVRI
jgi:hypothetical protein